MDKQTATTIQIEALVQASLQQVWDHYTKPQHIMEWNFATPEWHCPFAENDLREGGRFKWTMAAKDGSFSFDFEGVYTTVQPFKHLAYTMDDGRKASIDFQETGNGVAVQIEFEPESSNSMELQRDGWNAILQNFKNFTEARVQSQQN